MAPSEADVTTVLHRVESLVQSFDQIAVKSHVRRLGSMDDGVFDELSDDHETTAKEGGYEMKVRWSGRDDSLHAVGLVLIRPIGGKAKHRGVTSGVLRRFEEHLSQMIHEREIEADQNSAVADYSAMAEQVAALNPNDDEDYYPQLLELYKAVRLQRSKPINVLAELLGVPRGTVSSRLYTAKRKAGLL